MRVTNIDTISALLDRLITERIKHYFFSKDGLEEKTKHQDHVISEIKLKIDSAFKEILKKGNYEYISELRTFDENSIVEQLDQLVINDVNIGEADRERLAQVKSNSPDLDVLVRNEKRLRKANEGRSGNKNKIDLLISKLFKRI
jgi:hypothetical protein